MTSCHKLVLASGNRHKLEELRRALPGFAIEPLRREDPPAEDGATFESNARIKASWARAHAPTEAWALGEDSGIEVIVLGGAPGVLTARWAADEHVERMLAVLEGKEDRRARYVCSLVALAADGREVVTRGTLDGTIAHAAEGAEGFGFDPIFVPAGETRTVAVLGNDWKAAHSHRARAARRLAERLA